MSSDAALPIRLTRCDRCHVPAVDLWPVPVGDQVELRCALCAYGEAPVPVEQVRLRMLEWAGRYPALGRW